MRTDIGVLLPPRIGLLVTRTDRDQSAKVGRLWSDWLQWLADQVIVLTEALIGRITLPGGQCCLGRFDLRVVAQSIFLQESFQREWKKMDEDSWRECLRRDWKLRRCQSKHDRPDTIVWSLTTTFHSPCTYSCTSDTTYYSILVDPARISGWQSSQ